MKAQHEMPTPAEVDAVRQAYPGNKSSQIRALGEQGFARARIADALGVRYQFVRNVLEAGRAQPPYGVSEQGPPADALAPPQSLDRVFQFTVEPGGKITLPDHLLALFKVREGRVLAGELKGEALELYGPLEGVRRVQATIKPWQEGEPMWSEELIAERRAEAARE